MDFFERAGKPNEEAGARRQSAGPACLHCETNTGSDHFWQQRAAIAKKVPIWACQAGVGMQPSWELVRARQGNAACRRRTFATSRYRKDKA